MKICLSFALLAAAAHAQVQSAGAPIVRAALSNVHVLPSLDVQSAKLSAVKAPKDKEGGHEFGLDQLLNASALNGAGTWEQAANSSDVVWRYTVQSEGALSMLPVFSAWHMPPGASFFVYSPKEVAGAFTAENNKDNGQFAVRPLSGDSITFEYNGPKHPDLRLTVEKVIHVYRGFGLGAFGDSGSCNVNSACEEGVEWKNQAAGAVILLNTLSRGYCSGSMINSKSGDQLFLTAAHCTPGANDIIAFNYAAPTCDAPRAEPSLSKSAQGLTTLARSTASDFHLMRVNERLPPSYGVYLSGWDASGALSFDDVVSIHHPSADIQKISRSGDGVTQSGYSTPSGTTHYWVKTWTKGNFATEFDYGTTEGGSSGSPLYNEKKQIIGQLHGGRASCSFNYDDYYGAVWQSFDNGQDSNSLKPWLTSGDAITSMDGGPLPTL